MLDQDTSYRITRCYYIQGIHNGDFLGDEENIEAHHGDDEIYNVIRIMINELGRGNLEYCIMGVDSQNFLSKIRTAQLKQLSWL